MLSEQILGYKTLDQGKEGEVREVDVIISQFPVIIDSQDILCELIKHWAAVV